MNQATKSTSKRKRESATVGGGAQVEAPDPYRYDRFSPFLLLADMRFRKGSLTPGEQLPDLPVLTAEGTETSLRKVADGLPIALITGSTSCPMTVSALPSLRELDARYGDRVRFVLVNVREAHPGELIEQPHHLDAKLENARLLRDTHSVDWPVLVDGVDGALHRALDAKPNSLHVFDAEGSLLYRALFATDSTVEQALAAAAAGRTPKKANGRQLLRPTLKAAGYIHGVLRAAGRRAYRDVAFSAPPMAILGWLSNALPWLPKERRGLGVAVALAAVTATATAAFLLAG